MFKKHGVKVLIIAGILMIAAYIGYELITFPWVFGTDEEINAKVLPSPTMPPGEPGVDYIISTPPPGYFNESSGRVILAPNGTGQTTSPLYLSPDKDGYYWLIPEEIPLGVMQIPAEPKEAAPEEIPEETVFADDAMIQMFDPEEAPQAEEEEVIEITAVIKIPRLNLSECIYKGTGKEALKLGIGHLEGSELPNEEGNMVIAAHRSSNNAAPFKHLEQMKAGDFIEVNHWYRTYWYEVFEVIIVDKEDVWVLDDVEGMDYTLTLVTCDPYIYFGGNRPDRLIVRSQLKYIDEPVIENGVIVTQ